MSTPNEPVTRGAPKNTGGRPQRKPVPWPKRFKLDTRDDARAFHRNYIKTVWTENPMDSRAAGSLNMALRLLYELEGWIQKAPLQIIQAQTVVKFNVEELKQKLDAFSQEEQRVLARAIAKLEASTST